MAGPERPKGRVRTFVKNKAKRATGFVYGKIPEKARLAIARRKVARSQRTKIRQLAKELRGLERQIRAWQRTADEDRANLVRFQKRSLKSFEKGYADRNPQDVKDALCAGCERKGDASEAQAAKLQGELRALWTQRENLRYALGIGKRQPVATKK
ncbi:MAG: hypothetical protein NT067_06585 [Candidatus Diapherotrites archaeon]|nr:hypothetical protein [Candidatus Diapherotrites archaeon]